MRSVVYRSGSLSHAPARPTKSPPVGVAPLLPGPSGSDRSVHTITRRCVDEIYHLLYDRVSALWWITPRDPPSSCAGCTTTFIVIDGVTKQCVQ